MLATLFKDERCQQLATYGILEKMYLDRIIRGNQLQEFAAMLMPHQKATTADGGLNDLSGSRAALRLARRLREITGAFDIFSTTRFQHPGQSCDRAQPLVCQQTLQQHHLRRTRSSVGNPPRQGDSSVLAVVCAVRVSRCKIGSLVCFVQSVATSHCKKTKTNKER